MWTLKQRALMICALAGLLLTGCGKWPPIVETARDIESLPASQGSIRARGLRDSDIHALARLRELKTLDFHGGCAVMEAPITDEGLRQISLLELPLLDCLTLGECDGISDEGLAYLGKLQTITHLGLPACRGISNAGLSHLTTLRSLTSLDLRGCPCITDAGIQQLAAKANWRQIYLGGCPNVTSAGVAKLQAALPDANVQMDDAEWAMHGH